MIVSADRILNLTEAFVDGYVPGRLVMRLCPRAPWHLACIQQVKNIEL